MNFDYSDDQKFLKAEIRKFLEAHSPIAVVRRVLDDDAIAFDVELWKAVAAQGWLGAAIPEAYGGLGLGHVDLCAIAEELGRSLAPIPFVSTSYFLAEALMLAGTEEQKQLYLPRIAAGDLIGCFAVAEGRGGVAGAAVDCRVERGRLTGLKMPVTDGDIADLAVVLAVEDGEPGLFLVEMKNDSVATQVLHSLDPTRSVAKVSFAQSPAARLGGKGGGMGLAWRVLDRAAILIAFEQLGGADRCLEMARDYALERHAFGRVIGGYQAIKHKLADIYVRNEIARSNCYYGAWALSTGAPELTQAASAARIAACDAYWFAAKENIQTHGGMGFTWDIDCHLFYRRSKQLALVAHAPRVWKERLVSQLERRAA